MAAAKDVAPKKWTNITVLFDNGMYSVISGVYDDGDDGPAERIGERWNGKGVGYPSMAGYPVWYCAPTFLELPILHGLLDELARHPTPEAEEQVKRIHREIAKRIDRPITKTW